MPITVDLDPEKKLAPVPNPYAAENGDAYAKRMAEREEGLKLLEHSLEGDFFHNSYIGYLDLAWRSHFGVVLTPDIFWYTLLCELTAIVRDDVEGYRAFFSRSKEKIMVAVHTDDGRLPIAALIDKLRPLIPNQLSDQFLPEFSTTDEPAREARFAAFADVVSPYYSYGVYFCGLPAFRLEGTVRDWKRLRTCWTALSDVFAPKKAYCARVMAVINQVIDQFKGPDPAFLRDIYRVGESYCTPGTVRGWISDLFLNGEPSKWSPDYFPAHVSKVPYKNLETGAEYELRAGLFSSRLSGGFLIPTFGKMTFQKAPVSQHALAGK